VFYLQKFIFDYVDNKSVNIMHFLLLQIYLKRKEEKQSLSSLVLQYILQILFCGIKGYQNARVEKRIPVDPRIH
jgi:hypothetical protein